MFSDMLEIGDSAVSEMGLTDANPVVLEGLDAEHFGCLMDFLFCFKEL